MKIFNGVDDGETHMGILRKLVTLLAIFFLFPARVAFLQPTLAPKLVIESENITSIDWHPSNDILAASSDGKLQVYDTNTGEILSEFELFDNVIGAIKWDHDGSRIAVIGSDLSGTPPYDHLQILDVDAQEINESIYVFGVVSLAWSPNGQLLLTADGYSIDQQFSIWDAQTNERLQSFLANQENRYAGAGIWLSETQFVGALSDGTIHLWDLSTQLESELLVSDKEVFLGSDAGTANSLAYNSQRGLLAVAVYSNLEQLYEIWIWDIAASALVARLDKHERAITALAWNPDGKWLASASLDKTVVFWDTNTYTALATLAFDNFITSITLSPDAQYIAISEFDGTISIWDISTSGLPPS